jgi:hypothetical protein
MRTNLPSWLLASLLAGSAWSAHAQQVTWDFSYTGFFSTHRITHAIDGDSYVEGFEPATQVTGRFSGEDRDRDGIIGLDELTGFMVHGRDYFPCIENPGPYGRCGIRRFSYDLDGELDFSAGWSGYDEFYSGWAGSVTSGVHARDYSYGHFYESTRYLYWTDQTRFDIVQLPVPEPASGIMAVAGLMLLARLHRRQRRH